MNILDAVTNVINEIDGAIWGLPMIIFLLGSHIVLTFATKFVQRYTFKGIKLSLQKTNGGEGDVSVFGALMTALSSTIGTGNIIGVGTAIYFGGPGAVLWTWIGGIFGIATKYAESYIAVKHRVKHSNGEYSGGAMTVFEHLGKKGMAKFFAICAGLAAFGIGCATQSSAIVDSLKNTFSIPTWISGLVLCIITAIVIFGGVKSIARVCERLVPIMSIIYIIGCIAILIINGRYLPQTISLIVSSAFTTKAAAGGFVGTTIIIAARYGIARGLFSNEAGMGSAPMATAAGRTNNAVKPAIIGATGVFWDTVVVCLATGLVIVSSVISNDAISCLNFANGSELVSACFAQIPVIGTPLFVFGIITFAYSTILGWSYYGVTSVRYLFGHKSIKIYQALWIVVIFLGATVNLNTVWNISDILNAIMCIPNIIAVFMLLKPITKDTKYYLFDDNLDETDFDIE